MIEDGDFRHLFKLLTAIFDTYPKSWHYQQMNFERYLKDQVNKDLQRKMVFIGGLDRLAKPPSLPN